MIERISNNKLTPAIKRNAMWMIELTVTSTLSADDAQKRSVNVPTHLDVMIAEVTEHKVAIGIKCHKARTTEIHEAVAAIPNIVRSFFGMLARVVISTPTT
jgi:hypothetical protein